MESGRVRGTTALPLKSTDGARAPEVSERGKKVNPSSYKTEQKPKYGQNDVYWYKPLFLSLLYSIFIHPEESRRLTETTASSTEAVLERAPY